jgi:apolipoprotein N-acyltransferase
MLNNISPTLSKILFCAACVLSGWIAGFAMPPVSFWPALFVGISALYWLYGKTNTPLQAFATGFCFAIGYFVTNLWWIGNALLVEGNDYAWVWPISVIGLPTLLALFTGTYLSIARMYAPAHTLKGFLAFAFFLTLSEWTRGNAFTGFPWNLYGYVWADHIAMAQSFALFGAYGVTFLTIIWAAIVGFILHAKLPVQKACLYIGFLALNMAAVYAWGAHRLDNNPTTFDNKTGVVVVQPNIAQTMKWDPVKIQENFEKTIRLSKGAQFAGAEPENIFIVWPETAISPQIYMRPENVETMRSMLASYSTNSFLVTGILKRDDDGPDPVFANSIAFMNKDISSVSFYKKSHLVPFGEYIPLQKWIPLKPVAAFRGFEPGDGATLMSYNSDTPAFSPLICYEVIFPDKIVNKVQPRPHWIVNVTNDGWYGDSAGPHQHFAQTRLRAIEEGLPVIRSANTGISGVIDAYGRILEKADIFENGAVTSYLPTIVDNKSAYWPWAMQPILLIIGIIMMISLGRALQKKS